jgi:Uma2 family endonuclease
MATAIVNEPEPELAPALPRTVADVLRMMDVPAERILLRPAPGTATIEDAIRIDDREGRICELVDGVLVEKAMATTESLLASLLVHFLWIYLDANPIGIVLGEGGMLRIQPVMLRIPDVSFISKDRFPGGKLPKDRVFAIVPDLAVEILSPGNTVAEMDRKLREYFTAGTRLVWYVDPPTRTVRVWTSLTEMVELDESGVLEGGDVLPGFRLPIAEWFRRVE